MTRQSQRLLLRVLYVTLPEQSVCTSQASNYAIKMAQSASMAEAQASQARANLEKYVFGTPVSTVPPVVSPMPPASLSPYPNFPYQNSPMLWGSNTAPIRIASVGNLPAIITFSTVARSTRRELDLRNFL
jgi:hypothetical protein